MEELNINPQISKNTPFTVPEGYFEQLRANILARCEQPAEEAQGVVLPWWQRLARPLIGVAATVCLAIFSLSLYMNDTPAEVLLSDDSGAATSEEGRFVEDNAEDYILMDNDDMYRYLAGIY